MALERELIIRIHCNLCAFVKDFYSDAEADAYFSHGCHACGDGKSVSWSADDSDAPKPS